MSFGQKKGILSFSVFNKTNKPIYINWKNSSFIYNNVKLNYWIDEEQTNSSSYYGSYFYKGPLIKAGTSFNEGIEYSQSNSVKPEKVTFIPPNSLYSRSQFYILPVDFLKINADSFVKNEVKRNDNPSKLTNIYTAHFNKDNSPLKFRNFLSIAFEENSNNFIYIDNAFYLKSINEMKYSQFVTTQSNDNQINPYKSKTSFYLEVDESNSVEFYNKWYGDGK